MKDEKQDTSKISLTVTRTEAVKSQADKEFDDIQAEMEAELKAKAIGVATNEIIGSPKVKNILNQVIGMVPMVVEYGKKYFGKDEVRFMIYMDEETGALVFQKIYTANLEQLKWYDGKEPQEKDFFVVTKEDLDNPTEFIKRTQKQLKLDLF